MNQENRTIPVAVRRPEVPAKGASAASVFERLDPQGTCQTPLIDIFEGPEGLVLEADLPGVAEDHVTIQLEENVLSLHAKVRPCVSEQGRMLHEEYRVADYYRSFILSEEVERGEITAELRNGVLRLTLPKAERAKTRRIEIKS